MRAQLLTALAATAILVLMAPLLAAWLNSPELAPFLRLFALQIPLLVLVRSHQSLLMGRSAFGRATVLVFVYGLSRMVLVLTLVGAGLLLKGAILAAIGATFDPHSYSFHPTSAMNRMKEPFWQRLSGAGQRVGIMNVALCYPADPVNGFMLSGMPATCRMAGFCHPEGLLDTLICQNIDYAVGISNLPDLCCRNPELALSEARNLIHNRSRAAL